MLDKPFKTYDELVAIMERRGLRTNAETKFVLEREGYYAVVNGYKDPFLEKKAADQFKKDATFSELYELFVMDRHLRTTLFRFITLAEATLKSVCTYQFCMKHRDDNEAYLKASSYRKDGRYPQFVQSFVSKMAELAMKAPENGRSRSRAYVKHYATAHDNVPLWVIMNQLTLTQAFKFYTYQPESIRFSIAQRFQALYRETHDDDKRITHRKLQRAYDHIKDFRNICAHDERLYCARVDKSQSTYFKDVMADLNLVLTSRQYRSLCASVRNEVSACAANMHTISLNDIAKAMGYASFSDIR